MSVKVAEVALVKTDGFVIAIDANNDETGTTDWNPGGKLVVSSLLLMDGDVSRFSSAKSNVLVVDILIRNLRKRR